MKQFSFFLLLGLAFCCSARQSDIYTNIVDGAAVVSEYRSHDNLVYGIPSTNVDVIVDRDGYAIGFSNFHHQPLWTIYRLEREEVIVRNSSRTDNFRTDDLVAASATPNDYVRSGYDRGHLVPAADMGHSHWTMDSSFLMSNMSPQVGGLNRMGWRFLEAWVRDTAVVEQSIMVATGPIYTSTNFTTIGKSKVTVPDAFYKVVLDETPPCKIIGFVMLNQNITNDIRRYIVSVKELENCLDMRFFDKFSNIEELKEKQNNELSSQDPSILWRWK